MLLRGDAIRKKRSAHTGQHSTIAIPEPGERPLRTFTSLMKHINWSKFRPQRAGVVPYVVREDQLFFAFGLDAVYRELTDFGGGVSYKKDKTAVVGALREFQEESLGVFGDFSPKDVEACVVLYNEEMMIVFLPVTANPHATNKRFHEQLQTEENPEVCDIVWLSERELKQSLDPKSRLLYLRVRQLLGRGGDFTAFLRPSELSA